MKPAALFHAVALAALFAAHFAFAHEFSGVRRALQTMSSAAPASAAVVVVLQQA